MKKLAYVSIGSCILLLISSLTAYLLQFYQFKAIHLPVIYAIGLLVISGAIIFMARKYYFLNYIGFVLNGIALGFALTSWHLYRGFTNELYILCVLSLISCLYLWLFYLFTLIPLFDRHPNIVTIIFFLASVTGYVFLMVYTETTFLSTLGYYLIVEVGFIFALCAHSFTKNELFRNLTISTLSVFIVAVIILISIYSSDFDLDFSGTDFSLKDFKNNVKNNDNV